MSGSDSSLDQARQKALSQQWTVQGVVDHIDPNDLYNHRFLQWCQRVRDQLVPGLKQALRQSEEYSRLDISQLLLELGEASGADGFLDCLSSSDPCLQRSALTTLSLLPTKPLTEDSPVWQKPPVPLPKAAILMALEPFLTQPDSRAGNLAIDVAFNLDLPQAKQRLIPLLTSASPQVRTLVASGLIQLAEDQGALEVAETLLFDERYDAFESHRIITALEHCAKGKKPELAGLAANLLVRYILENLDTSDNRNANRIWNAMRGIEAAQHPQEIPMLEAVLQSAMEPWVRGMALRRLGELEGDAGLIRLQNALSDTHLRKFAAEGIAKVATGREDVALTNPLVAVLQAETRPDVLGAIISALIAMGEEVTAVLETQKDRLKPYDAMRIFWISNGITPETAAVQLVEAGVISPPTQDSLVKLAEDWQANHQPIHIILSLLAASHRLTHFDCETSPVNHARLIEDWVNISADIFKVEAASQSWQRKNPDVSAPDVSAPDVKAPNTHNLDTHNRDDDLSYQVQFIHNNKVHRFQAACWGDWYDVNAVLLALNLALEDASLTERFFLLHTEGQDCLVTFAPAKTFLQVARSLYIPLEQDPQAAMHRGTAYEQYSAGQIAQGTQ